MVRTKRGIELVEAAIEEGWIIKKKMPEATVNHLIFAAGNKKKRAIEKAARDGLLNASGKGERSALRIKEGVIANILGEQG